MCLHAELRPFCIIKITNTKLPILNYQYFAAKILLDITAYSVHLFLGSERGV
jgi:hypothetical protein